MAIPSQHCNFGLSTAAFCYGLAICSALHAQGVPPQATAARPESAATQEPAPSLAPHPQDSRDAAERITDRSYYVRLIRQRAEKEGVPADLAEAVAHVESGFRPEMLGAVGEIGLMQVRPGTAAMLGFEGTEEQLALPEINVKYGVAYLARAWRLAGGQICRALMKYRAGHGEERMTARSIEYCLRARTYLSQVNSKLAGSFTFENLTLPAHTDASPLTSARVKPVSAHPPKFANSNAFWAWKYAQIAALKEKVHQKWARMARMASASP